MKYFKIIFLILCLVFLVSCKRSNHNEQTNPTIETPIVEPDGIKISILGLDGAGSLSSPYEVVITLGEGIEKPMRVIGDFQGLEYYFGQIDNQSFIMQNQTAHFGFNKNHNDQWFSIYAKTLGTSVLKIKGIGFSSSIYVKIHVVTHDGSNELVKDYQNGLKVLAIGNSFSQDAMTYLYEIAHAYGMQDVTFAYLHIGGASLERHHTHMMHGGASYEYWKNTQNQWQQLGMSTLEDGILDETWDIITLQQVSGLSGQINSFEPFLTELIDYVQSKAKGNPDLYWHQTWAYANHSTHGDFSKYQNDQLNMFLSIMQTMKYHIAPKEAFKNIIPSGAAIQNVRTSLIGDDVTRDGFHLNEYGKFVAGLMWFKTLTGFSLDSLTYRPNNISLIQLEIAKEAVEHAHRIKTEITPSNMTSEG